MVVAKECGALLTLNHSLAILPLMFSLCFRVGLDENEDGIVIPGLTGARDSLTVDMEVRSSKEKRSRNRRFNGVFYRSGDDLIYPFFFVHTNHLFFPSGNANNFGSKQKCKSACSVPQKDNSDSAAGNRKGCTLEKKTGPCRAAFMKWHYNSEANRCEQFIYGGCHGRFLKSNRE